MEDVINACTQILKHSFFIIETVDSIIPKRQVQKNITQLFWLPFGAVEIRIVLIIEIRLV